MNQLIQIQKEFHADMMILHNKYIDKITVMEDLEDDPNNTEEETLEDDISKQITPKQMQTELESIENSSEQEQVWERMQKARSALRELEYKESVDEKNSPGLISDETSKVTIKENNLVVETNLNDVLKTDKLSGELTEDLDGDPSEKDLDGDPSEKCSPCVAPDMIKPPPINALYRINPKQRKEVLMDMYNSAVENMNELSKFDDEIKNNLEEEISKESNRLLQLYLDTH
jgi:hypothetical protein